VTAYVIPAGTKVVVTGATGFTGSLLVRKLVERGAAVTAIARASSNRSPLADLSINWITGDVFDREAVAQAVKGAEYIFHVAAAYREPGITDEQYERVHVTSTKLLAEAALGEPTFKRFVHVSTVGVHGHIDSPPADETAPFHPGDVYQVTKAEAEKWLHAFAAEKNLPYTVIRPAAIYGPGDKRLLKIFKLAKRKFFPVLGYGKGLYHFIHVDDLTEIILLAALHPRAAGEAFIAGNPAADQLVSVARIIADEIGNRGLTIVRVPAWPFFLLAFLCEKVCGFIGVAPPIYRRRVAFFTKDRSFDTRKLSQRLGYVVRRSSEEGLRETARWYVTNGWL
jgi:nucleoside-diphosphate-sugar epimerase